MGQHHALRRSRGSRRIHQHRHLPAAAFFQRLGDCGLVERADADVVQGGNTANCRLAARCMARRFFRNAGCGLGLTTMAQASIRLAARSRLASAMQFSLTIMIRSPGRMPSE